MATTRLKYGKLKIIAGKATPAPPITPCLGQRGINIRDFCTKFNTESVKNFKDETLPLRVDFYLDPKSKALQMDIKGPSLTEIVMDMLGVKKGASNIGREKVGEMSKKQLDEIVQRVLKYKYMNTSKLDSIARTVISIAKSIGIKYVG